MPELDALLAQRPDASPAAVFGGGGGGGLPPVNAGQVDHLRLQPGQKTRHGPLEIADQAKRDIQAASSEAQAKLAAQGLELVLVQPRVDAVSTEGAGAFLQAMDHGQLADECLADARFDEGMSHLDDMGRCLEKSSDAIEPKDPALAGEVRAQATETKATRDQFDNRLTRGLYEMVAQGTLERLGPGDRIKANAGIAAGEGAKLGVEGSLEIEAFSRPDGTLGYKVIAEGAVLGKGDLKHGSGVEGQAAIGVAVELEADSPAEAAELAARLYLAATPAGFCAQVVEGTLTGDVGGLTEKIKSVTLKAALSGEEDADLGSFGSQKASGQMEKSVTLHFENGRAVAAESGLLVGGGVQAKLGTAAKKEVVGTPTTSLAGGNGSIELKQKIPLTGEYDLERSLRDGFDLLSGFPLTKGRDVEVHARTDVRAVSRGVKSDVTAHGPSDQLDLGAMWDQLQRGQGVQLPPGWDGEAKVTPYEYADVGGKIDVEVLEMEARFERVDVDDRAIVATAL